MPLSDHDKTEAQRMVEQLREDAARLAEHSRQLADESQRLRQRADDVAELLRQQDERDERMN